MNLGNVVSKLFVDSIFPTKPLFMLAVRLACQELKVSNPRVGKSDKRRVIYYCSGTDPTCPFHVTANHHPELGGWRVTTCNLAHGEKCETNSDNGFSANKTSLSAHVYFQSRQRA